MSSRDLSIASSVWDQVRSRPARPRDSGAKLELEAPRQERMIETVVVPSFSRQIPHENTFEPYVKEAYSLWDDVDSHLIKTGVDRFKDVAQIALRQAARAVMISEQGCFLMLDEPARKGVVGYKKLLVQWAEMLCGMYGKQKPSGVSGIIDYVSALVLHAHVLAACRDVENAKDCLSEAIAEAERLPVDVQRDHGISVANMLRTRAAYRALNDEYAASARDLDKAYDKWLDPEGLDKAKKVENLAHAGFALMQIHRRQEAKAKFVKFVEEAEIFHADFEAVAYQLALFAGVDSPDDLLKYAALANKSRVERQSRGYKRRDDADTSKTRVDILCGAVTAMKAATQTSKGCSNCHAEVEALKLCGRCQKVGYCSKECQRTHWKAGHKKMCTGPKPLKVEAKK